MLRFVIYAPANEIVTRACGAPMHTSSASCTETVDQYGEETMSWT